MMSSAGNRQRQVSVLLVEDSPLIAVRVAEILDSISGVLRADTLDTEEGAIARLEAGDIDVIVLDLNLRKGTGFGVLRSLATKAAPKPTVIVLTNFDLPEYRRAATELGARHFLDKARDFETLPQLFEQIIKGEQAPSSPS